MISGLSATIIESPLEIQKSLKIPADHLQQCIDSGRATTGNAAGNTKDYLDLSGENKSPEILPAGYVSMPSFDLCSTTLAVVDNLDS
jgi:iron transport multicopper oxidase